MLCPGTLPKHRMRFSGYDLHGDHSCSCRAVVGQCRRAARSCRLVLYRFLDYGTSTGQPAEPRMCVIVVVMKDQLNFKRPKRQDNFYCVRSVGIFFGLEFGNVSKSFDVTMGEHKIPYHTYRIWTGTGTLHCIDQHHDHYRTCGWEYPAGNKVCCIRLKPVSF